MGEKAYLTHCASCHGETFRGSFGPALKGPEFLEKWNKIEQEESLYDYIVSTMPPADPGGLTPDVYKQINQYLLESRPQSTPNGKINEAPTVVKNETSGIAVAVQNQDAIYHKVIKQHMSILADISNVEETDLRQPSDEDWLNWRRSDDGLGYSTLDQINRNNVKGLTLAWSKAIENGTNSITPLVHDGVMFINSNGTVLAIDLISGDTLWKFNRRATVSPIGPPVTQPRSMAIFKDSLYVPTLDNHMIALNIRSGKVIWDKLVSGVQDTLRMTSGPIVVRGKVIQGMSGCAGIGEPGGCFIIAFDAENGKELWRFSTIAKKGEVNGNTWNGADDKIRFGGSVWTAGTYNERDNLVYFGTGQTYHIAPLMEPAERTEKNSALYTDTTLALNPDTGELVWHYQHMARDVWDLDWPFERMIMSLPDDREKRKVVVTMGKIGILDVMDAKTGQFIFSFDLGLQNIVTKIDPITGWKTTDPALEPDAKELKTVCPFALGVRNWPATSYDPVNNMLYVPLILNSCMTFSWSPGEGLDIGYGIKASENSDGNFGAVAAINLKTRKLAWMNRFRAPAASATLSTAGGVVFSGGRDRKFRAFDSVTGEILWQKKLDNILSAFPITYAKDGIQYVAITSGGGNPTDILTQTLTPELEPANRGTTLWVFKLPDTGTRKGARK
ncbi:MAG: PQQ-binding-like beta-propeller repeat protein [Emcibacter sp.]|nr:PQQ-binding-like beta-propeller repeat protein [Emcibacter sp.]